MRTFGSLTLSAAIGTLAVVPAAFGQVDVFEYRVSTELNSVFDERLEFEYIGPLNAGVSDPTGTVAARADVGVGVNKAVARLNGPNSANPVETAAVDAFAEWGDVVTISRPNLNGTPGTFTARLRVNGTGTATMSPSFVNDPDVFFLAHWAAVTSVGPTKNGTIDFQDFGFGGEWFQGFGQSIQYGGDPLNAYQEDFTAQFIYGEPFVLSTFLQSFLVFGNNPKELTQGTVNSTIDLGNSAYWAGISAIRNAQGQVVTGATLTSQSGVQWQAEVDANSFRGDFDDNGLVNLADFNILASHFGRSVAPWQLGDATGDGLVNLADFNRLANNFGLPAADPGGPTPDDWAALGAAVPEPGSALGASAFAVVAVARRRRAR